MLQIVSLRDVFSCLVILDPSFPADFRDNVHLAIPKLIGITLDDEDEDVRSAGVTGLTSLARDGIMNLFIFLVRFYIFISDKLQDTIIQALPKSLDSVFKDPELRSGRGGILEILTHRTLLQHSL